jgi:hypothetical protein
MDCGQITIYNNRKLFDRKAGLRSLSGGLFAFNDSCHGQYVLLNDTTAARCSKEFPAGVVKFLQIFNQTSP